MGERAIPSEQKVRTHARVVAAASRLFRRHGESAISVVRVMDEVGLTHGGFYAHFRDKTALVTEAIEHAFDEAEANLFARGFERLVGAEWLEAAGKRYLSEAHRVRPEGGCAIPAMGAEVSRGPRRARRGFGLRMDGMVDGIAARLVADGDGRPPTEAAARAARREAIRILARWVGALTMARATSDPVVAREILDAAR